MNDDKTSITDQKKNRLNEKSKTENYFIKEVKIEILLQLHKQIIRKFKKQKVYSSFRDNI